VILLIDNYDSFTYNLYQYLCELGADVEVRRNDQVSVAEIKLMSPERIIISPGPCTPADAGISIELVRSLAGRIPILGVCLGHQAIGAAFGADIVRAPLVMHGKTCKVSHCGSGIFTGLRNPLTATRYHSLIVDGQTLPDELEVTARSDDGIIMGLSHRKLDVHGVQFHPESILTEGGHRLLANFINVAGPVAPVRGY
jgi:anthranilate synthase/aminodeoxychorismate synthase-like glutamine amidotransferase